MTLKVHSEFFLSDQYFTFIKQNNQITVFRIEPIQLSVDVARTWFALVVLYYYNTHLTCDNCVFSLLAGYLLCSDYNVYLYYFFSNSSHPPRLHIVSITFDTTYISWQASVVFIETYFHQHSYSIICDSYPSWRTIHILVTSLVGYHVHRND